MTSISFDSVAHQYEATRAMPESVVQRVVQAMDQAVSGNSRTRLLEVGVGTGRYALPLAQLGRQYTGIDISDNMLSQLERKLQATGWQEDEQAEKNFADEHPSLKGKVQRFIHQENPGSLRLALADMTAIPFADASFDAVIASHVFHLISNWPQALQEIVRVLHKGGVLLSSQSGNWEELWQPGLDDIRKRWCQFAQELGGNTRHPGASDKEVADWLQAAGFETEQVAVINWQQEITPRAIFDGIAQRLWTSTLVVPDDIFTASLKRLQQWMDKQYGNTIDTVYIQENQVVVSKTRV